MGKKFTIGVLIGNVHTAHPKDLMRGIRAAASGMDVNVIYFLGTQSVRFNQKFALEDFDYQYNTDRKSTRLNSSHPNPSRMPSSA